MKPNKTEDSGNIEKPKRWASHGGYFDFNIVVRTFYLRKNNYWLSKGSKN